MSTRIQVRRDTAANWTSANPVLSAGEPAFETDTGKQKIGDGSTAWTSLAYAGGTHSHAESDVTNLTTDLAAKAALASPTFTGTPAAPTAAQGTNTTQLATTAYVQTEVGLVVPKSLVDAKGDLLVGTADNTVARLAVGADGTVPQADSTQAGGIAWKHRSRSISDTHTDTTVSNTTAETTVASQAIPTTVVAGDVVRLFMVGDFLNNTGGSVNYTYKVIVGATTVAASAATGYATSAQRRFFLLTAELLVVNPASDQRVRIYGEGSGTGTTGILGGNALNTLLAGRGVATEDLTAGKNFQMSVTIGTASANADFVSHESWLEVVKR